MPPLFEISTYDETREYTIGYVYAATLDIATEYAKIVYADKISYGITVTNIMPKMVTEKELLQLKEINKDITDLTKEIEELTEKRKKLMKYV